MSVWIVAAVPLLIMLFALLMERVETGLRHVAVQEDDVEQLLESARPDEVRALFGYGIGRALELFWLRRVGRTATIRAQPIRDRPTLSESDRRQRGAA